MNKENSPVGQGCMRWRITGKRPKAVFCGFGNVLQECGLHRHTHLSSQWIAHLISVNFTICKLCLNKRKKKTKQRQTKGSLIKIPEINTLCYWTEKNLYYFKVKIKDTHMTFKNSNCGNRMDENITQNKPTMGPYVNHLSSLSLIFLTE